MRDSFVSINPANEKVLGRYDAHTEEEIEKRLALSVDAFRFFRRLPVSERASLMIRLANVLEKNKSLYARTITLEMGKLLRAAVQEIEKCALTCRYYAQNGAQFLADEQIQTEADASFVRFQPLGPLLAIMPWNFPFWQLFRFAAPSLMAGNVVVLKHASNVPQCALAIENVFREAAWPEGVFQTLLIGSDRVSRVIEDERIRAVTLTGSVAAGQSVAKVAGSKIKKTVLELGGSDPFIVMPSADLEKAVQTAVQARTINNGQSCIAAKRFIVHEDIARNFEKRFVEAMSSLKVGNPSEDSTDLGPIATSDVLHQLENQVGETIQRGGKRLFGGHRIGTEGYYFAPTVLTDIPPDSPAARDELFGPVASIFRVGDIEQAINVANNSTFGLGAAAWTNDANEQDQFASELECGAVFINGMVASDPHLPFGGIKNSGYGRELGREGIREFVNIKTVSIRNGNAKPAILE